MMGPLVGRVLLVVAVTRGQYLEDSLKYEEVVKASEAELEASLRMAESVREVLYPAGDYYNRDEYKEAEPHPQLYALGMIVDPCANLTWDCCEGRFGSASYGRIKQDLVDFGERSTSSETFPLILADPEEILANVDLVDADGSEADADERRRADDELYLAEECAGSRRGIGEDDTDEAQNSKPYKVTETGELMKTTPYTHCLGSRLGARPFPTKPACFDNNATVNASKSCVDPETGQEESHCLQVAVTQTALIVNCASSGSRNGRDFSDDPHCGTYLEIHRPNGSPYEPDENFVINSKRLTETHASGYHTTAISLRYGLNESRILCDYFETTVRVGSMVYITANAPECCCPPEYNNDDRTGLFFCPQNAYDATSGPFARKLSTLDHHIAFNTSIDTYPYCPAVEETRDDVLCSTNSSSFGPSGRVYSALCPSLSSNANASYYTSPFLTASYDSRCFFYEACAGNPLRSGAFADLSASSDALSATNFGCAYQCLDANCDRDSYFSFRGQVGKVTCVPSEDHTCVDMSLEKFDDDESYYLVSFNDNRTSYPFRLTDLVLQRPNFNYQLWWVQRTPHDFRIQKKKNFRVHHPTCTFDSVNDRYFPYVILNRDGSYLDTL